MNWARSFAVVAGFTGVVSTAGCIDVGHPAETGCLVDMTQPGCQPGGTGGGPGDASTPRVNDASTAPDARRVDAALADRDVLLDASDDGAALADGELDGDDDEAASVSDSAPD